MFDLDCGVKERYECVCGSMFLFECVFDCVSVVWPDFLCVLESMCVYMCTVITLSRLAMVA